MLVPTDARPRGASAPSPLRARPERSCRRMSSPIPDGAEAQGESRRQRLARFVHAARLLPALGGLRSALRRDLRLLAYHRVRDIGRLDAFEFDLELVSASAAQFRAQMHWISTRMHPVSMRDVLAALDGGAPLPRDAVVVTFDDGYDDNYTVAFPILRELGVPATFFVSTGHIESGMPYRYDWLVHMLCRTDATRLLAPEIGVDAAIPAARAERRQLAEYLLDRIKSLDDAGQLALIARLEREWSLPCAAPHPDCHPLGWAQLREMQDAGMEIGGHGVHHRMLAKLPREEMREELRQCKAALDRELPRPVFALSYPVGGLDAVDAEVTAAASDVGFRLGCTYVSGTWRMRGDDRFMIPRLPVERMMDDAWFAAMVSLPEVFSYHSRVRAA